MKIEYSTIFLMLTLFLFSVGCGQDGDTTKLEEGIDDRSPTGTAVLEAEGSWESNAQLSFFAEEGCKYDVSFYKTTGFFVAHFRTLDECTDILNGGQVALFLNDSFFEYPTEINGDSVRRLLKSGNIKRTNDGIHTAKIELLPVEEGGTSSTFTISGELETLCSEEFWDCSNQIPIRRR